MLAIYKREVRSYFNSMIGCVFAAFLTIIGGVYFMVYNLYSGYPFFAYSLAGVIFCANLRERSAQISCESLFIL